MPHSHVMAHLAQTHPQLGGIGFESAVPDGPRSARLAKGQCGDRTQDADTYAHKAGQGETADGVDGCGQADRRHHRDQPHGLGSARKL